MLGVTIAEREAIRRACCATTARKDSTGLSGFRLFHDHDPPRSGAVLADPRCAKIILTRNPLESYVIVADRARNRAVEADRWQSAENRKSARLITRGLKRIWKTAGVSGHVEDALQQTGQTAF